jgi:hypothetical protein
MKIATALAVGSAGLMAASHYIPERVTGRELRLLERYALGILFGILLPYAVWSRDKRNVAALFVIAVGAGVGTVAAHGADEIAGRRAEDATGI